MIGRELLSGGSSSVEKALSLLSYSIGSRLKIQILICSPSEEILEAYLKQGGKLSEVNESREKAGLHSIRIGKNKKILSESWVESLRSGKGAVFVVLNGFNRMKSNPLIESAIEYTSEHCSDVSFDKFDGLQGNDFFFCYLKEETVEEVEDPSEEILDLQNEKPKKKKRTTSKSE